MQRKAATAATTTAVIRVAEYWVFELELELKLVLFLEPATGSRQPTRACDVLK